MGEAKNAAERLQGGMKEKVGDITGDDDLQAEGRGEQAKADVKDVGEKVKDAAQKAKDAITR